MPRLRRSNLEHPGVTRRRRGRGFSYVWEDTGKTVDDPEVLDRIATLAIPPAWVKVWISPWPNGHIQAVGTDTAGRRQYRYHDDWRKRRDEEKFARILEFGAALPDLRKQVKRDLGRPGLDRRRVLAATVRLLDIGCFRIGSEEYAKEHETFGVATLRKQHVTVKGPEITFRYPAKGSIERTLTVDEAAVADVIGALRRRRGGDQLFAWKDGRTWTEIHSGDVNTYIKEATGDHFSAKDFRTWSGTVFAAAQFAGIVGEFTSPAARKRALAKAVKEVATFLGNTPAVCRASYIDPRVIDRFAGGETISDHGWPSGASRGEALREATEAALLLMLSETVAETAA